MSLHLPPQYLDCIAAGEFVTCVSKNGLLDNDLRYAVLIAPRSMFPAQLTTIFTQQDSPNYYTPLVKKGSFPFLATASTFCSSRAMGVRVQHHSAVER
jgi:hypothetical protein